MMVRTTYLRALVAAATVATVVAIAAGPNPVAQQTQRPGPQQQPSRDTPAQKQDATPVTGLIAGRVLAADTGRPVKRARVFVSAAELPGGRGVLTDDAGVFQLVELPGGRYTLSVSKSRFWSLSYA